jgi:hypothetical protein
VAGIMLAICVKELLPFSFKTLRPQRRKWHTRHHSAYLAATPLLAIVTLPASKHFIGETSETLVLSRNRKLERVSRIAEEVLSK